MQRNEHATATKHDKKINGRDARKMLNKRLALSHGQFIHYEVQISMAKRKCKTDSRLSEINTSLKFQITMLSSEQQNNMIENLNMTSKNMAWSYSTSLTKVP